MAPPAFGWPVQYSCAPQLQRRLPGGAAAPVNSTVTNAPANGFGATVRSSSATFTAAAMPVHAFTASVRSASAVGSTAHIPAAYGGVAGVRSSSTTTNPLSVSGFVGVATARNLGTATGVPTQTAPSRGLSAAAVPSATTASASGQRNLTCAIASADGSTRNAVHGTHNSTAVVAATGVAARSGKGRNNSPTTSAFVASTPAQSGLAEALPRRGPARAPSEDSDDDVIAPSRLFSANKRMLLISTINFLFKNISRDPMEIETTPNCETFKAFQEEQYHHNKVSSPFLDPFTKTLQDSSAGHVAEFVLMMLHRGYFDVSEFIISAVYLVRFKDKTGISLHVSAWRPLFITALLLADKMWEDKSVKNSSLTMLFPVLSNAELFDLEVRFLEWLGFSAWVTRKDFQKFCEMLLLVDGSTPEISAQVFNSEYAAALQDTAAAEAPGGGKATSASVRLRGKGTRPEQPWNARKTLHGYSPTKRLSPVPSAGLPVGQGLLPSQQNGLSDSESAFGSISPRRKFAQGPATGPPPWKAGPPLQHASSVGTVRKRVNDGECIHGTAPDGCLASASASTVAQSPRQVTTPLGPPGAELQAHERRPNSEPRVVPPVVVAAVGAQGGARLAKGRPPQSTGGTCGQPRAPTQAVQPVAVASAASPRSEHVGGVEPKREAGGVMPADRCSSEPAALVRSAQQHASASAPAPRGPQVPSLPAQAAPHSRSASTVAQAVKPPPAQQRIGFPFGPTARSTVPIPGTARTTRPGQPMVMPVQEIRRAAAPSSNHGGAPVANIVHSTAAILGRGRSSSPAGIADGGYAPPQSARRNVAAPPPTIRPGGLRFA